MAGIATKALVHNYHDMAAAQSKRVQPRYQSPEAVSQIMLSESLRGTKRFGEAKQLDLLNQQKANRGDARLYFAGDISLLQRPCVAVVGTRQVSKFGALRTERLARELVTSGVVVVSGLAYGVDTIAHHTAMTNYGKTIAVIGTPLDIASPSENAKLQEAIYREHLLISQFSSDTKTSRANFPVRNRLMAILTDATVVVEASDTSGTLHQAAECTKQGRWLFITKSMVDDKTLTWPKQFLKYSTCEVLEDVSQITERIKSSQ